jgi:hypothetical protein
MRLCIEELPKFFSKRFAPYLAPIFHCAIHHDDKMLSIAFFFIPHAIARNATSITAITYTKPSLL